MAIPRLCLLVVTLLCAGLARAEAPGEQLASIVAAPDPFAEAPSGLTGIASWYGYHHNGRRTADGEIYHSRLLTAAHRGLPFGTLVKVTNLKSGNQVVVRINDRGPYAPGRVIDLSEGAARRLGMLADGLAPVSIEIIGHRG